MVRMQEMEFHHLYQENVSERQITIFFTVRDVLYYLIIIQNEEDVFTPARIVHITDQHCPFCQRNVRSELTCYGLQSERFPLFQRLISEPKLRLFWVYVKHIEE